MQQRKAANQRPETTVEAPRRPIPRKGVTHAHVPLAVAGLKPRRPNELVKVGVGVFPPGELTDA